MNKKKIILIAFGLIFLLAGIPAAVFLVRQRQELRKRAAVPEGEATANLFPPSSSADVGEPFPIQVLFNTGGVEVSAVSIRLSYSYSETEPPVVVHGEINTIIESINGWKCLFAKASGSNEQYNIDFACIYINPDSEYLETGYSTITDVTLVSFNLVANKVPNTNPIFLDFDREESVVTTKAGAQDTLEYPIIPAGSYTIVGEELVCDLSFPVEGPTGTPTPTGTLTPTPTPTETPTPTPTGTPGPTVTPTPTSPPGATPTPTTPPGATATPTLPPGVTPTATPTPITLEVGERPPGFTLPTLGAIVGGILLIITSLLLAL